MPQKFLEREAHWLERAQQWRGSALSQRAFALKLIQCGRRATGCACVCGEPVALDLDPACVVKVQSRR